MKTAINCQDCKNSTSGICKVHFNWERFWLERPKFGVKDTKYQEQIYKLREYLRKNLSEFGFPKEEGIYGLVDGMIRGLIDVIISRGS